MATKQSIEDWGLVKPFADYITAEYRSELVFKGDSATAKVVGAFLDAISVMDKEVFLERYTTVLHRTIYIPFTLGQPSQYYPSAWSQLRVLVHEHAHIDQGDRDGWMTYSASYLTSQMARATYEAEAYGADMEMENWKAKRFAQHFDAYAYGQQRAESLRSYACKPPAIEHAKAILNIRAGIVTQGGVSTRSAKRSIAWLEGRLG
jgi:hypothetical protein